MNFDSNNMTDKFGKLWKALTCGIFPRRDGVSYFNFVIHCEKIYDDIIYRGLLAFAKEFFELTAKKIVICVATPFCPVVARELHGNARNIFADRVLKLGEYAHIGYHGHFYKEEDGVISQISAKNYDADMVMRQMREEIGWLKRLGLSPKIYVAGWWFLTDDIIIELERSGVLVDLSVRKGKADTFGTKYLDDRNIPEYGEPFVLPPSRLIVEVQSLFGPVMPPFIMKYHLAQYLCGKNRGDLFFAFPLHDWDIPKYYSNILSNVIMLKKSLGGHMDWMNIPDMREAYMSKNGGLDGRGTR